MSNVKIDHRRRSLRGIYGRVARRVSDYEGSTVSPEAVKQRIRKGGCPVTAKFYESELQKSLKREKEKKTQGDAIRKTLSKFERTIKNQNN
jgi:hypothetical protein